MSLRKPSLKLVRVLVIIILIAMFSFLGYKLSYKKDLEKIGAAILK